MIKGFYKWWYEKKYLTKVIFLMLAIFIILLSLIYSQYLAKLLSIKERKNIELWSEAIKSIADSENPNADYTLLFKILAINQDIPAVLVDTSKVVLATTIEDPNKVEHIAKKLFKKNNVIPVETAYFTQYIYYGDSKLLAILKYFPIIQISVISFFGLIGYLLFNATKKTEQNNLWIGMAKETAHQLGTPISSILGWIELLKISDDEQTKELVTDELTHDITRLQLIADRFSKIGAPPELHLSDINEVVIYTVEYMRRRSPKMIQFTRTSSFNHQIISCNNLLMSWVLENIIRNAIDAMHDNGFLTVHTSIESGQVCIDIADSGKGIQKNKISNIFEPGFSTKKRGWGLGLSLAKRIVEEYHNGKIFVKKSELNIGTTFRITLPIPISNTH